MMKVCEALLLLAHVAFAAATEQPLVQCAVPVHVRFIVSAQQLQPEFSEDIRPGQKHWSAYKCQMNVADIDGFGEARMLQFASNYSDDENETTTTTTSTTTTSTMNSSAPSVIVNETVAAELGGSCGLKAWASGLLSLGLSLSLPVAEAAPGPFMAPSQPQKVKELVEVVVVLMPCSALLDPLRDLDGDGAFDCKVTQEQNNIAESLSEVDGTWHILSAQSVSSGGLPSEHPLHANSITLGGGAMCVDSSKDARWADKLEQIDKAQLPLVLTNIARFTHDAKPCVSEKACEASMWSFDLAYPASSCTPEVASWVQACTAKLLPDGTLVLVRGAPVQSGSSARRPPLMASVSYAADALPFANGLAAATQSSFEVLILHKYQGTLHDAFRRGDADGNGMLSYSEFQMAIANGACVAASSEPSSSVPSARQLQSSSNSDVHIIDVDIIAELRQLQSDTNFSEDDNETITVTAATTVNSTVNSTAAVTVAPAEAETGQARDLRVWSTIFFCLALRFLIH